MLLALAHVVTGKHGLESIRFFVIKTMIQWSNVPMLDYCESLILQNQQIFEILAICARKEATRTKRTHTHEGKERNKEEKTMEKLERFFKFIPDRAFWSG